MAYICNLPKGSCSDCWHFRYDEENGRLACFAAQDEKNNECPLGGDLADNCADCAYSGDYRYDPITGDCVRRDMYRHDPFKGGCVRCDNEQEAEPDGK